MHTNNCSNIDRFDKVVAKIKLCSFFCLTMYTLWQLARHCHLRQLVSSAVLGFTNEFPGAVLQIYTKFS